MAHAGEKIRFCIICRLGQSQGIPQKLLLTGLLGTLVVQNPQQDDSQRSVTIRVLYLYNVGGDPVIFIVTSFFLKFGINLRILVIKLFQNIILREGLKEYFFV